MTYEKFAELDKKYGGDCVWLFFSQRFWKKLNGNYDRDGHEDWASVAWQQMRYYFNILSLRASGELDNLISIDMSFVQLDHD